MPSERGLEPQCHSNLSPGAKAWQVLEHASAQLVSTLQSRRRRRVSGDQDPSRPAIASSVLAKTPWKLSLLAARPCAAAKTPAEEPKPVMRDKGVEANYSVTWPHSPACGREAGSSGTPAPGAWQFAGWESQVARLGRPASQQRSSLNTRAWKRTHAALLFLPALMWQMHACASARSRGAGPVNTRGCDSDNSIRP